MDIRVIQDEEYYQKESQPFGIFRIYLVDDFGYIVLL